MKKNLLPKKKPGRPKITPEIKDARVRKRQAILNWLAKKKNCDVQEYRDIWAIAIAEGKAKKPILLVIMANDFWVWHSRACNLMVADGCSFEEALEKTYPQSRPVRSEEELRRKLDELKGIAYGSRGETADVQAGSEPEEGQTGS